MEVIGLQIFVSLMLVVGSLLLFAFSAKQRDHEHNDRLALLPLETDAIHDGAASGPKPRTSGELSLASSSTHDGAASGPKPRTSGELSLASSSTRPSIDSHAAGAGAPQAEVAKHGFES